MMTPLEATKHEGKIRELATEYSEKQILKTADYGVKGMCEKDFMAGFKKCEELNSIKTTFFKKRDGERTPDGYFIENIATIFITDTLLCSTKDRDLREYMMEKHKWDEKEFQKMKNIYLSWMCKRSSNIDAYGKIINNQS